MHPRTQEILDFLDRSDAEFARAVASVPRELHNQQPGPDRWSVAEIVEHVALTEGRIAGRIARELDSARNNGLRRESDTSPVVPTFDVAPVIDRSRTVVASDEVMPHAGIDGDQAMSALADQHRALRDIVVSTDGLALGDVVVPHRVFGPINLYQWLVFTGAHEVRHAAQVREAGNQLT